MGAGNAGIVYHEIPGAPGRYFHCATYRLTLSNTACAANYRRAKDPKNEVYSLCRGCQTGATHAGEKAVPKPAYMACVRCNRSSFRLVRKVLCPSCANRQYEVEKGRNGRGKPPRPVSIFFEGERNHGTIMQVHRVAVQCVETGRIELRAATLAEAYRHVSRKRPGTCFAWTAPALPRR